MGFYRHAREGHAPGQRTRTGGRPDTAARAMDNLSTTNRRSLTGSLANCPVDAMQAQEDLGMGT